MNKKISKAKTVLGRYKYAITFITFLILIGVVDENSLLTRLQQKREINAMQNEIERYEKMIKHATERLNELAGSEERTVGKEC